MMKKDIIVHESPKSPVSEAIRLLRTNISFLCRNKDNQVLLVTSAAPGDGKSWVSANLAIAYAQSKKKVLLVDADLRKGRQHKIFGRYNTVGFSNYLSGLVEVKNNIQDQTELLLKSITTTEIDNLFLITSGVIPPNPSELIASEYMDVFISIVKESFDIIIFDAPPVSIVADSLLMCKKVDYVVLVAAADQTKRDLLLNAKKSIENVGGKISGVVLNKMPANKVKELNKYYTHYSEEITNTKRKRKKGTKK